MTAPAADWPCEAYGPDGLDAGARCFAAAEIGERTCLTAEDCAGIMAAERQRVYRRLQELAAAGDPVAKLLADDFTSPGKLLGGTEDNR